jgi:hypothetical protein
MFRRIVTLDIADGIHTKEPSVSQALTYIVYFLLTRRRVVDHRIRMHLRLSRSRLSFDQLLDVPGSDAFQMSSMLLEARNSVDARDAGMLAKVQKATKGRPITDIDCRTRCSECDRLLDKQAFQPRQWTRTDGLHFCWNCVKMHTDQGMHMRCNRCGSWKSSPAFAKAARHNSCLTTRVCEGCRRKARGRLVTNVDRRTRCSECNHVLGKQAFQLRQWTRMDGLHFCVNCVKMHMDQGVHMRCNRCGTWKSPPSFAKAVRHNSNLTTRLCWDCQETTEDEPVTSVDCLRQSRVKAPRLL